MSCKPLKELWAALNWETNIETKDFVKFNDGWWRWSWPFVPSKFDLNMFLKFHALLNAGSEASISIIRIKAMKRYTHFYSRYSGFPKFLSTWAQVYLFLRKALIVSTCVPLQLFYMLIYSLKGIPVLCCHSYAFFMVTTRRTLYRLIYHWKSTYLEKNE